MTAHIENASFDVTVDEHTEHRLLHSFPTRRSSDLGVPREAQFILQKRQSLSRRDPQLPLDQVEPGNHLGDRVLDRSEEHTSELQSRENLVCRLLLEKKKNKSC